MTTSRDRTYYVPRPNRGDQRREQLLAALEQLLANRPLAEITIAEIARAAGVTRSAFYFYFPTKAAAVAALLADFRDQMEKAGAPWYERHPGTPYDRLKAGIAQSMRLWREHASLLVAMFDAAGVDPDVHEVWETWTRGFIDQIAARITQDRDEGLTHPSADPHALATVLIGATFYGMECDARAIVNGLPPLDHIGAALVELWHRTLYPPS